MGLFIVVYFWYNNHWPWVSVASTSKVFKGVGCRILSPVYVYLHAATTSLSLSYLKETP